MKKWIQAQNQLEVRDPVKPGKGLVRTQFTAAGMSLALSAYELQANLGRVYRLPAMLTHPEAKTRSRWRTGTAMGILV